ncbi:ion transporter [Streptomyces europaeiscabiei]|uniref:ion transporter n=1 Tax=Streptomyces europaeiscabiei TaxID=146819 RepID=UPI0029A76927|nr:ion transporter [Streptomyces europaeiscabiei]MDX3582249.1 ion transporter [Streptomyces europaeiscabiei]MDX3617784.1 ion transporter [Streptomyces europaeiscabiei]MDX3630687.1 ion transporter [Streptomyces europaeiscabiei]MDX3648824.1 ion transporter [Streptomyces europaeiscabiei]WUD30674.1 ion transporter [Streptomyces europaeiscabiei]
MTDEHDQHDRTSTDRRPLRRALAEWARAVTEARWFGVTVFALILSNAALLGVETYSALVAGWGVWLRLAEHAFLVAFTVEILLRACAHADRPRDFLRDPWNLFDLTVVVSAFLPVARENGTVLRLLRLARVLRTARFLPQLRVFMVAVGRSLPGTFSFLLVGALLLYVYAMVGWVFFADHDPEHFGSLGRAVLTLFLLMTLDGLGDAVRAGLEISRWSIVYYASYVLFASFVLVNVLIGVVISSLDEAREMEREQEREQEMAEREQRETEPGRQETEPGEQEREPGHQERGRAPGAARPATGGCTAAAEDELRVRILAAREALDALESSLRQGLPSRHEEPSRRREAEEPVPQPSGRN